MNHVKIQLVGSIAIASLLCVEALLATSVHAATPPQAPVRLSQNRPGEAANFTKVFSCRQFRVTLVGNMDSGRFTYRTSGLTMNNGTYEPSGAGSLFTFRNGNYRYTLEDRGDGSGELESFQTLRDGGQDLEVREECTVR